jgi:hypothetical protein
MLALCIHFFGGVFMKRSLTVFVAIGLITVFLGACKTLTQQKPSLSPPVTAGAPAETTVQASKPPESPSPSPAGSTAPAGLDRGVWDANVYTNAFAKLMFTLPEGWAAATDEQIAALMGQAADILTDKQKWLAESAKLTTIYDMMAQDPVTASSVAVMFENLSVSGGTKLTEEEYLDLVTQQMAALETMNYTFEEPYETTIGGAAYKTVQAYEETNKVTQFYMVRKQDQYMVILLITIAGDTKIDDILAYFKL